MPVRPHGRFELLCDVGVVSGEGLRAREVVEGAPVVTRAAIGAAESCKQIGILSRLALDLVQQSERLGPISFSGQRHSEADTRPDVRRLFAKHRTKRGLGVSRPAQAQLEDARPHPRVEIRRILLDDAIEQIKSLRRSSRTSEIFSLASLLAWNRRLQRERDGESRGEGTDHTTSRTSPRGRNSCVKCGWVRPQAFYIWCTDVRTSSGPCTCRSALASPAPCCRSR
jgi:hypothetical protein